MAIDRSDIGYAFGKFSNWITILGLSITLFSCGGSQTPPPEPPPAQTNSAPAVTSASTATVEERSTDIFYTAIATDNDGDTVTFSITGDDAAFFDFDTAAGTLAFAESADFENPDDNDGDNVYDLVLIATDGTASTNFNLSVTVTDVTNVPIRVTRVAETLDGPIYGTGAGDGSERLFIVEQRGRIRIIDLSDDADPTLLQVPFLDITPQLSTGFEQGLLGLAFAPDYAQSGLFYVYITNLAGDTEVLEFTVSNNDANLADPTSQRLILTFPQPFNNHNAGWIDFGPDNMLYIASGDGGSAGDPQNNSQNTDNLLGTILRIDPTGDDFPADANANYAIPADNPFVNQPGADEIWAFGLRNPFRASFDRLTGDIYIGDVGQDTIEEVDLIPAGQGGLNFGWNILEGTQPFTGTSSPNLTPPIAEYPHNDTERGGFSITGGYVHRGSVEALFGQYVFADFISGNVWSIPVSTLSDGETVPAEDFIIRNQDLTTPDFGTIANISSFAEDDDGELYIIELFRNEIFRIENDED